MIRFIKFIYFFVLIFAFSSNANAQNKVTSSVMTLDQLLELEDLDAKQYLGKVYKSLHYPESLRDNGVKYEIEFNLLLLGDNQAQFEYLNETPIELKEEIENAFQLANDLIPSRLKNVTVNITAEFKNMDLHHGTISPMRNADIFITCSAITSCGPAPNR